MAVKTKAAEEEKKTDPVADPQEEENTKPSEDEVADGEETGEDDPKEESRLAYELRQSRKRLDEVEKELQGHRRREEDARREKMSTEERLTEELKLAKEELQTSKMEALRSKIGQEFNLPPVLTAALVGSDEESMRRHAEELKSVLPRPRAGTNTQPTKETTQPTQTFTRDQLKDPEFFRAHQAEILQAYKDGRIKK